MQIPCISCQSRFRLDSNLVEATGSLVRCSKCGYIFMVYPPATAAEPVLKETNIDQSILFDLFNVEQTAKDRGIITDTSTIFNINKVDEIAYFLEFEEEQDVQEPGIEDIDLAELPDLSEYEKMIDWDNPPDEDDFTEPETQFYNKTQDLDINEG